MKKFLKLLTLTWAVIPTVSFTPSYTTEHVTDITVVTQEAAAQKVTVMWDLGETLFTVNKMGMFSELGFDALTYIIFDAHFDSDQIQHKIFEVLTLIGGCQEGPEEFKCKHNGTMNLPKNMALWLAGVYENPYAWLEELEQGITELEKVGFFVSKRECRLIRKAVRAMFDPEVLIKYQKPIKNMFKLLERVHEAGHTNLVLSNWDAVSYNLFLETASGQKLLQFVDEKNMVISGRIGLNKPHPSFFEYVLHTYQLDPAHCILIDNDCANCASAESVGIPTFCINDNIEELEQELINRNILK